MALAIVSVWLAGCGDKPPEAEPFHAQVARIQKEADPIQRTRKLISVAEKQSKALDTAGATDTLQLAARACKEIEDPASRANSYALLVEKQIKLENPSAAAGSFEGGTAAADKIESADEKAWALARLGLAFGLLPQNAAAAAEQIYKAEELTAQITDKYIADKALVTVAQAYARIGKTAESERVATDVKKRALAAKQCEILADLALMQHQVQQKEAARATFQQAVETARTIDKAHGQANGLADIAQRLVQAGDVQQARQLLREADNLTAKVPEKDLMEQTQARVRTLMGKLPK